MRQLSAIFIVIPSLLILSCPCYGYFNFYPKIQEHTVTGNPGPNLILNVLIDQGKIDEARTACKNTPLKGNITSYSGFITVDKMSNANMFFWFFPAAIGNKTAPVILWLQGGPGATSMYGVFSEHGPFSVKTRHGLKLRKDTWITSHSVIYIDNPVGTGFSYTVSDGGYSTDSSGVGLNLHKALTVFFQIFPEYRKNDFFIAGESYAAKFVAALANTIDTKNPSSSVKINLKGLAIGNGLCDPEEMLGYGEYFYQIGLLNGNGRDQFLNKQHSILSKIQQKKWTDALSDFNLLLGGDITKSSSILHSLTNLSNFLNYLDTENTLSDMGRYLSLQGVRKNLHVGNVPFNVNPVNVQTKFANDIMQSVAPWIQTLLEKYRVLLYNGQLDMVVPFPLTESFVNSLRWSGSSQFKQAPRKPWYVGEELAGYSQAGGKLTLVLVRNAGHMVAMDQPVYALDLIRRFTRNVPF